MTPNNASRVSYNGAVGVITVLHYTFVLIVTVHSEINTGQTLNQMHVLDAQEFLPFEFYISVGVHTVQLKQESENQFKFVLHCGIIGF